MVMKTKLLATGCIAFVTAATVWAADPSPMPAASGEHTTKVAAGSAGKVQEIDAYVRGVEKNISSDSRKEEKLSPGELKKVTDENWSKIQTYTDGTSLKRMKLYPPAGSQRTEEFYYRDDQPVFVFLEANGAGKENHDAKAVGDKYYFEKGKLVAAIGADGKEMDIKSAAAQKMADKLHKESQAFRATVK